MKKEAKKKERNEPKEHKPNWKEYVATIEDIEQFLDERVLLRRPEEMIGAHARRYNAHSIGICYEGGLDANGEPDDTRTPARKRALVALLRSLKVDYPDARILGHRDLPWVKKDCPCFDARAEYLTLTPLKLEQ